MINKSKFLNLKVTAIKSKNRLQTNKLVLKNKTRIKENYNKSFLKTEKNK